MTTQEIARLLVDFLNRRQFVEAIHALYGPDIESRENAGEPTCGYEAVLANNEQWVRAHTIQRFDVAGCYVDVDTIVLEMNSDFTHTPTGRAIHSEEVGIYKVAGGKIRSTRFYYGY